MALGAAATVFSAPADIARGLVWLQAQVQANGLLAVESQVAAPQQARCETAATLLKLAGGNAQVAALVASLEEPVADAATVNLACWQQLRQRLGQPVPASALEARRVSQQGYVPLEGYGVAGALDTGWALTAQLQNLEEVDKDKALAWLQTVQRADGSFGPDGQALLNTAVVLRATNDESVRNPTAAQIASKAAAWLLAARSTQGHWLDDVGTTALVYEAVHPYTGQDFTIASALEAYLLDKKQADDSWAGDPYVTALALRALSLTSVVPIDPALASAAALRGIASAGDTGQPLANVTIRATAAGGTSKSAVTDARGAYLLQGVPPGGVTLSATRTGYQSVSTSAQLGSATTAIFSPALYAEGATPASGGHIVGRVVGYGTDTPLPGVTVTVAPGSGSSIVGATDSDGGFDLAVPAAGVVATYSLAGYVSQSQQVILTSGGRADVGTVTLRRSRETSTLRGVVSDVTGQPIAGARVQVGAASAVTNNGGSYSLSALSGTVFDTRVSAPGFATQSLVITVTQPIDVVQDFFLAGASTGYLVLSDMQAPAAAVGLRRDITATVVVSNPSAQVASWGLLMEVVSPDGKLVATTPATDDMGNPLPALTVDPGLQTTARFKWNTGSFAAGSYQLVAKLYLPGSIARESPSGTVVGSLRGNLSIASSAHFAGSVTANPPVSRAGTNTPVSLSALIQNDGNAPLPVQDYKLSVVDTRNGQITHTQTISGAALPVSQLQPLAFASWIPPSAGDFRVELVAPSTPGSLVTSTLYVGSGGQADFTVDKPIVPSGTQKVRGSVTVSGQRISDGVLTDPLAPLVQQAVTRAVDYADNIAYEQSYNRQCFLCHVQAQAIVGGERSLRYAAPVDALKRSAILSAMSQRVHNADGSWGGPTTDAGVIPGSPDARITNTTLSLWGLSQWHDPAAVNYTKTRLARYLMDAQRPDGSWTVDHPGTWWQTKAPLAALNTASLSALKTELQTRPFTLGGKKFKKVETIGALPSGTKRLTADAAGTLYVSVLGSSLWTVSSAGVATKLSNLPANTALPLADGRVLIGTTGGLYVRHTDGTEIAISPGLPLRDIKPLPDGDYLAITHSWDPAPKLYRVKPSGQVSTFADHPWIGGKTDATVMPDGSITVLNNANKNLVRLTANGQVKDVPVSRAPAATLQTAMSYKDGLLLTTEGGLFFYDKNWVAQRWSHEWVFSSVEMPDGRVLVNYKDGIYEVQDNPVDAAALMAKIDASVASSTTWLTDETGFDGSNNIDVAFRLMGLGSAKKHLQGAARAADFDALMESLGTILRNRQRADGGWIWKIDPTIPPDRTSDSMVTAMVGVALDTLNPSPNAPEVRSAISFLLKMQGADGTWTTAPGLATTALLPTTWVEIWLPAMLDRLAHLDTDLRVTFPPTVVMSSPDHPPAATLQETDGSTTYLWRLTVPEDGQQINFDLTLNDMQVDEVRPVAQQANLIFKNSFVDGSVTAAITVPSVAVTTNLTQTVSTDKPVYTESDQAIFTATVTNAGTAARTGRVRFSVLDTAGQLVQTLPLPAALDVPGGSSVGSVAGWSVGGVLAGDYQLRAELLSPTGLLYGAATTSFTVTASQWQVDSTRILTDRPTYTAAQNVQVISRAANLTVNAVQEDLRLVTTLRNEAGQTAFTRTEAIAQLAPGAQRQYSYGIAANGLAVGNYTAGLQLLNGQGATLSQSNTSFAVLGTDQSGVGVTGQLQASPLVLIGQPVALSLSATNAGSSGLTNVPITVRVVDPTRGSVVASFAQTVASWPQGASQALSWTWPAQGLDGQTFVAVASANIGGWEVALGQASIRLAGAPKLNAEPTQLGFPTIYAGETAPLQTVTATSTGSITATSVTLSLAGANPSQFVIPPGECTRSSSLGTGATCTFAVSYRPSEVGSHSAQARIGYTNGTDVVILLDGQARPVVLGGSVMPEPRQVAVGETTSLGYSLSNPANVSVNAAVSLRLLDTSGNLVASWPIAASIAGSATSAGNQSYIPAITPQTLQVVLSQTVDASSVVLATSTLIVTEIPVKVDPIAQLRPEARILVLVSCPLGSSANDSAPPDDAACVQQRSLGISSYLTSLGLVHKVVSTQEDFKREMCCGQYNTYWISGGAAKLGTEMVGQLREAIWAGEALITDGVHGSRNALLHPVNGILHRGKLPVADHAISIAQGSIYTPGGLPTLGQPFKPELLPGAQAQAWFTQIPGNQEPVPAIVFNRYGNGNSLLFAFDMAGMVTADPQAGNAPLRDVMGVTASQSANGTQTLTVGDLTALTLSVSNQGTRSTSVEVRASLPTGLVHHSASIEPTSVQQPGAGAGTVTWTISLGSLQSRELIWRVLAHQAGIVELPVAFYSVPRVLGETARLLDTRSFTLRVESATQLMQDALFAVLPLQPGAANDKNNKTKALDAVQQATSLHSQGRYQDAITQWLAAADALIAIGSADSTAARDAVAKALEASTDALCRAAP